MQGSAGSNAAAAMTVLRALSTCWGPSRCGKIAAWIPNPPPPQYKNHRFPVEIISHAVWLYFRFCLSFRDVEEILFERGVGVTYEAIRKWCRKFGQQYANQLRRRRPRPGDKWHLDEVFLTIKGERHYLWRAVDQDGNVLDILVQTPAGQAGREEVFPQAAQGLNVRAARDRHRQAQKLWSRQARASSRRRTSSAPLPQ